MPRGKRKVIVGPGGHLKVNPALTTNAIVKDVSKLMQTLRNADADTLKEARTVLQTFADSWLESGDNNNFPHAGDCCLSDTDLTTALVPVLDVWLDMEPGDE